MPEPPISPVDLRFIREQVSADFEELRGQRLFITGGTGFFGCWLMESFCDLNRELALGAQATVLTRNPAAFAAKLPHIASDPAISLQAGDVSNFEFPIGEFHFVIHAATEASAKQAADEPLAMLKTILAGTERTLEFARARGTRKLLLTSSGAVYGKQPADLTHVPETYAGAPDPLNPGSVYSEGKRASELMCALYSKTYGFESKIARCWAFCGPHLPLDTHFAIGNFIADALAGRPIRIGGDGTPRRSYLYASDLAVWLWRILFRAPALVPVNVGSANDCSILELAQAVKRSLGAAGEIIVAKELVPGAEVARYVPAVYRAAELLNLTETIGLEETIRKTADWYVSGTNL